MKTLEAFTRDHQVYTNGRDLTRINQIFELFGFLPPIFSNLQTIDKEFVTLYTQIDTQSGSPYREYKSLYRLMEQLEELYGEDLADEIQCQQSDDDIFITIVLLG